MQQQDTPAAVLPTTSSSSPANSPTVQFLGRGPQDTPRLGLGLAALGRSSKQTQKDVESMQQHCWAMLDEAWALGVHYFDAARSYGLAEEFLTGWLQLRGVPADSVVVGSKWG